MPWGVPPAALPWPSSWSVAFDGAVAVVDDSASDGECSVDCGDAGAGTGTDTGICSPSLISLVSSVMALYGDAALCFARVGSETILTSVMTSVSRVWGIKGTFPVSCRASSSCNGDFGVLASLEGLLFVRFDNVGNVNEERRIDAKFSLAKGVSAMLISSHNSGLLFAFGYSFMYLFMICSGMLGECAKRRSISCRAKGIKSVR